MIAFSAMWDSPVSRAEFAALISGYGASPMAVGVSGGADSLALLVLLARHRAGGLFALSVDHGLRAQAAHEVRHVARVSRKLGVPHIILRHRGILGSGQAAARRVRFELLAAWCRRNHVRYCALAHQQADQVETFLFRLARGSGVDGLAAMQSQRRDFRFDVDFIRPLLDVPRACLEAVLIQEGIPWREDPSNSDPAYSRTHLSRALAILAEAGISADRLARAARSAARLRGVLSDAAADFLRREVEFTAAGYCWLPRDAFAALPRAVSERVLGGILRRIGGRAFRPSAEKLANFYNDFYRGLGAHQMLSSWMLSGRTFSGRTLSGCRIVPRGARLLIFRELADIGPSIYLRSGGRGIWDRRFQVRVSDGLGAPHEQFEIAPLGLNCSRDIETDIPPIVRPSLPALWREGRLVSVPHLGLAADCLAVLSI